MDTERAGESESTPPADPRVDHAVAALAGLPAAPLEEHPGILEAVHDRLREILGELAVPAERTSPPPSPPQGPRR